MKIITDSSTVSIGMNGVDDTMDCFIDIYIDGAIPSPFEKVSDAELFAEIILKLLNTIIEEKHESSGG